MNNELQVPQSKGVFSLLFLLIFNDPFYHVLELSRCLYQEFNRIFKAFIWNYNLSTVVLVEPMISWQKANDFILKSDFNRSHRIEAVGFSEGIWAL